MLGLFGTLNLGSRSLAAQQQASEITGNNLANVNNNAYSREKLVIESSTPLDTPVGQEGTGVDAVSIEQFRDSFLDGQIASQNSDTGSLTSQQSTLQTAEAYLNEQIEDSSAASASAGSMNGLANSLSTLFNTFQSLSTNPTSLSQRQTVVATAQEVANQFNQLSTQLGVVTKAANNSVQTDVAASNQDLADIANLNEEISTATSLGGSPNELIDQRQAKIEDLASKSNISTSTESNGSVDVSIGGVTMVSGFTTPDQLQTYTNSAGNTLVQAKNAGTNLTITGGSIGGSITARDGALATLKSNLDTLASNLASSVNSVYQTATGTAFFTGSTAGTIAVNTSIAADPSTLQAGVGAADDNSLAKAIGALSHTAISGLQGQTFTQSYAATVASLGNSISTVNDQLDNSQAVAQLLNNQRSSVSGVNTDEEMTNLLQYQKAYQASAQLISTINSMLQTVIQMKTS